jgi:hypothetical protein
MDTVMLRKDFNIQQKSYPIYPTYKSPRLEVCTKLPKLPLRNRLRKDSTIEQLEQIPLPSTTLCLKVPENPPISLRLKSIKLRLNVPSRIILPRLTPRIHPSALPGAGSDFPATRERAFISIACSEAVEVWRAIGQGAGPLADDCPFV